MRATDPTERLLRRVEARAEVREDLCAAVRGVLGTIAIVGVIVSLLLAVLVGAIGFATIMSMLAG